MQNVHSYAFNHSYRTFGEIHCFIGFYIGLRMLDAGCKIPDIYCWLFDHECLDWRVVIDILGMVLNVRKWLKK